MMDGQDGMDEDFVDPNYIIAGQDTLYCDDQASDQPYALHRYEIDNNDPWHPNNIGEVPDTQRWPASDGYPYRHSPDSSEKGNQGSANEAHPRDDSTEEPKSLTDPKDNKELKKNKKKKASKGDRKNDTKGHSKKPRKDEDPKKKHHGQKERNYHGQAA